MTGAAPAAAPRFRVRGHVERDPVASPRACVTEPGRKWWRLGRGGNREPPRYRSTEPGVSRGPGRAGVKRCRTPLWASGTHSPRRRGTESYRSYGRWGRRPGGSAGPAEQVRCGGPFKSAARRARRVDEERRRHPMASVGREAAVQWERGGGAGGLEFAGRWERRGARGGRCYRGSPGA